MTLTSAFGTAPRTFSTTDPLPGGLTLHANGVIDGTPTTPGTFDFTVKVTDSLMATCSALCTIKVVAAPACPDWTTMAWDPPLTIVNSTFAGSGDHFTATTASIGALQVYGRIPNYNGPQCNANLHLVIVNTPNPVLANVQINNNGNGSQILNLSLPSGTYDIPFVTNGFGVPYEIQALITLQTSVGGQSMSVTGTFSNVP